MNSERQPGRARRRRLLALAALLVTSAYLLLLSVGADRASARPDAGEPTYTAATSWHYAPALEAGALENAVRVWRWAPLRRLANAIAGPIRVGVQVGHLAAEEQPDELESLRLSTGGHWQGIDEVDVNLEVATHLAAALASHGIEVDLLPATVPVAYRADLLISVHVDANENEARNGYKSAHFRPARSAHEPLLKLLVDRAMLATGFADDDRNVSGNMLGYYGFNQRRFRHAAHRRTPALLVELGYLSNEADRQRLARPAALAAALESGVLDYLSAVGRIP